MSCLITYNNTQMPEKEFIEKYIPKEGEIIDYNGIEYMVHDANVSGSQLLRGESQLAIYEDGDQLATERLESLDSIPVYNLDPVGKGTVVLGGIDPIFNIPLTTLLQNGFTKTGKTFDIGEYGNPFTPNINLDFQLEEATGSKASKETLELVKNAAKQMGVSIQDLADYAKSVGLDTKSINGVADLTRGVIAVAQGMEDVALTEELVHIARSIIEQVNPQLVTSMISKIDRFKIYKITLEKYKDNKNYQLPNGKPDIRKIKQEAVDKLIAELIINNSEGSTEFPELMQEENRSLVRVWWDTILDFIRGIYSKSNIDIFQTAATTIATGNVGGTVSDISQEGTFYQIKNDVVDEIYNKFITEANKLTGPFLATATDKRHYKYDGERVAMTVTEKTKGDVPYERSAAQKVQDDMKRDWGSEGHRFLDKFITTNLIDENGYKKPNSEIAIQSKLNPDIQEKLEIFAENLINSYPAGTRFLIEKKVINTKVKGMMASTLDFAAIIPQEDGSAKLDILDWKFANIDRAKSEDIPFFKQKEWNAQMNEYTIIANQYGVKTKDIRQARMVPFVTGYNHAIVGDKKSPLVLTTLEVGDPTDPKLNSIYTLPVPVTSELTGNPAIDKLLGGLRAQYDKLRKLQVAPEKESTKIRQLEKLSIAIRSLHVKLDFAPLAAVGDTFLRNSAEVIKGFENLDYDKLSADEIKAKLQELLSYENSAKKFTNLDSVFLSQFPKDGLSKEDRDVLASLEHQASVTKRMLEKILDLQKEYAVQLAVKEQVVTKEKAGTILDAEKEVGFIAKTFTEALDLPAKIIRLGAKLILESKNLINLKVAEILDDFKPKLIALEREAEARGTTAFNMIGKVTDSGLQLIKKIDPEFFKQFNEAKENKDKSFILANINIDEYNTKVKKIIDAEIEDINRTTYTTRSVDENYDKQQLEIKKLRDRLDLSRDTFNGYKDYVFDRLFKETMKDELHLSPEYKQMAKSKAALDVWEFFTELNKRARKAGYLDREGNSFFPLVEASLLQKMSQSGSILGQAKDFFADLYTATEDEEQNLSKIDPETNKIKKEIPKYFKRSRKSVDQLSRDLNKVGTLWVKSLLEYENAKNLENTLLTLQKVEEAKGSIVLEGGEIVWEGDMPKVDDSVNKNAAIFEAIINDHLYGLREDLSSLGNISLGSVLGKIIKDEDKKQQKVVSIKKGLRNSDILVQTLAVGLKPLISIANYFGYNFQAYINAGGRYKFGEFTTNNRKITTGIGLTNEEKALLHLIMPLNESISEEKRREIAKEKGLMDWLGTWSFSDVMMSTNSFPERKLQYANAMSMNENSMVVDGKIVNIRQYVKKQDQKRYKTLDEFERRNLEKTFDARVKALQETSSLEKVVKIDGDKITIPGVSTEELAKYRTTVVEYGRKLNGQMSLDNKAGYRRDSIFSSFMMFKNWIPKQVSLRASDIKKDLVLDEWSYGRTRLFVKTWAQLGTRNIMKMRDIINGTDEGLRILDEMLAAKKEEHFRKTGEELDITDEEFYDLVRTELTNELKELQLLIGTMALILAAGAAVPDDDDTLDPVTRNRYKYLMKAMNKIEDELSFYYKPTSMESMTRGSVLPSLGMLSKVEKLITNTVNETYGYVSDDPKMMDKAHPLKYFFNLVPGFAQVQSEVLPTFFPELAKAQDIRVSPESRMR